MVIPMKAWWPYLKKVCQRLRIPWLRFMSSYIFRGQQLLQVGWRDVDVLTFEGLEGPRRFIYVRPSRFEKPQGQWRTSGWRDSACFFF